MDDYLPLNEAARRLGISELPVWTDPLDRRRRLLRRRDLDRYAKPRPREVQPVPA